MSDKDQTTGRAQLTSEREFGDNALSPPIHVAAEQATHLKAEATKDVSRHHWDYAKETHDYIRDFIRLADQKATFFATATMALVAYMAKQDLVSLTLDIQAATAVMLITFISSWCLVTCSLLCLISVLPSLKGSSRGIVFFKSIKEFESRTSFREEVQATSADILLGEKISHIYDLAGICSRKFFMLGIALYIGSAGLVLSIYLIATH